MPEQVTTDTTKDVLKWCTHCGVQKPLDEFHLDITRDDGHRSVCKECRASVDADAREDEMDPRIKVVEEDLAEAVATMPPGGTCSPHHAEIGEAIMRRCGGVDGYARLYMAHVYCTKPGSSERGKSLRDIMQLHVKLSETGGERLETLSEGDLQRIMVGAMREYQDKMGLSSDAIPALDAPSKKTTKVLA